MHLLTIFHFVAIICVASSMSIGEFTLLFYSIIELKMIFILTLNLKEKQKNVENGHKNE